MAASPRSHQRRLSAISTSSAIRSASPSPAASPNSPNPSEGLFRRLSWNRPEQPETATLSPNAASTRTMNPDFTSSSTNLIHQPDEIDLGSGMGYEERDTRPRPSLHVLDSQVSLDSNQAPSDIPDDEDQVHLTPNRNVQFPKRQSRIYDTDGMAHAGPIRLTNSVRRNNTFKSVGRTLRKASVRVVNIMGKDERDDIAMVRLDDGGGEADDGKYEMEEVRGDVPMPQGLVESARPEAMPPEGLRGRTLGLFTGNSRTRKGMDWVLRFTWTEPIILLLIIVNAVVLAIQAASPVYTPRIDSGYFQSWEDIVLLILFTMFTLEMFARIVVTGLILDPEISLYDYLFAPTGVLSRIARRITNTRSNLQRSTSKVVKTTWQDRAQSDHQKELSPKTKGKRVFTEAPFQQAVAKQRSLSTSGRPFLRHSWHRIDLLAVMSFWITFVLAVTRQEATAARHVYIFRALSVLRTGRLLVITSGTTTILHSLKRAGPLLVTVAYFLIFAAGLFSIIGVQSFGGSFRRQCMLTDPGDITNIINTGQACGGYLDPGTLDEMQYLNEDGSVSGVIVKGYICPINQVCQTTSTNPNGGVTSFDNVFLSLVQVIIIASVNTWTPVMYMAMDSDYFSSSLFFIVAVVVLNFWLINLLVAVVVNTFSDIRAETRRSAFGADDKPVGVDPQWEAKTNRKKSNPVLVLYKRTELFWTLLVLADVVAQGCKTADSSESFLSLLKNIELAFTLAFDLEIAIRLLAHLPEWQTFFASGRNNFDLFLAAVTSIIQIPAITKAQVYPWFTSFQLSRWYRVILAFPRMKPLLVTVFGSFAGLLNMVIFLFLINFIGALVGVQLLRGEISSGNTINFSQTYNSFLGMYQIFSSENWTTIMYDAVATEWAFNSFQGWLAVIFLCGWFLFSNFIILQMFIAVINENFAVAEEQKRKRQIEAFIRKAEPSSAHVSWIDRLNPYRLVKARHQAVRVEALPPDLILPLKQNVGSDVGGSSAKLTSQGRMTGTKRAMQRLLGRGDEADGTQLSNVRRMRSVRYGEQEEYDDDRGLTELLPPLNAGPAADEHMDALCERRNQQADFINAHPTFDQSLWLFKQSNPIRRFCQACVSPAYGERIFGSPVNPLLRIALKIIVFCSVVASIVVAAIASPVYRKNYYTQYNVHRGSWFDLVEVALGTIFVFEAGVKIIADGFIFAPNAYLLSLWNVFDFVILITLLVNTTTSLIYIGGLSRVTRSLKGFRALRLITLFGRLRDTLHAVLFAGALKILDASVLMILYIIPFAVWGLNIFSGLLYSCNDSDATGRSICTGVYASSPVDNSLSFLAPRVWANPTLTASVWAFDSFRQSVLILFEIVSLEGWIDVMSSVMNIVERDVQPRTNASQWNAIFMLIFNLFGGVIILTLFVSIIIGNFSTRSGNALLTSEQRQWVDLYKYIKAQTPSQLPKLRPRLHLRAWCYDRAVNKHGFWSRGFTGIYFIHILLLMAEDYSENIFTDNQLNWIFLVLTILYAIDLLVRFYGLGFKSFRANGWNIFDLVVITGCFATTIPALQVAHNGSSAKQANIQLQKLFLVSISLKLVQRIGVLNQLFKTSVASLPAIGNLFLLWATLFIFFGILYLEVFGLTKAGNNSGSRFQNFYSFGNTLVMLSFMSTGEGWNSYMHDYTVTYPRCTESENFLLSDCGSPSWAFGLFISWNILSMYIFLNMFTGVVVESFAYVYQMPGGASLNREEMRSFKKLWAEFDTERTGYIRRKDFVRFCSRLTGVFEVRLYPKGYSVSNLVRYSIPDPVDNAAGRLLVVTGVKRAVDVRKVEAQIDQINCAQVRERRQLFTRLYNEAKTSDEPGKGISFTGMLVLLAHHKLIDDEKALQLDDLLRRRAKTERVTDMINLDRVRGLLRTVYWRRRFLAVRDERRRALAAESGIPEIVLQRIPATPPMDGEYDSFHANPFGDRMDLTPSPPSSRGSSPEMRGVPFDSPMVSGRGIRHSPSLSVNSQLGSSLGRKPSNSSMLSSEDAHYATDSRVDQGLMEPSNSLWGEMMREDVDEEET